MKKILFYTFLFALALTPYTNAQESVFDSSDSPIEVQLAPSITTTEDIKPKATNVNTVSSQTQTQNVHTGSIKEEKFNQALVNLDDAQVEMRQELQEVSARYNEALAEKERALLNCKNLKTEIKNINKKMKNVEKSKKIINKNIETEK